MPSLSEADRRDLLGLARRAIVEAVRHDRLLEPIPTHGVFAERRGTFVSVHVCGRLRGCIGVIEGEQPLGESIVRCATGAALQDARFIRVSSEELQDLTIEISLLSPLFAIPAQEIEIGRHGLVISQGQRRGLLLPQVATEHRFDRERFLQETCRKAGLASDAWHEPEASIRAFTCEVFSEGGRGNE